MARVKAVAAAMIEVAWIALLVVSTVAAGWGASWAVGAPIGFGSDRATIILMDGTRIEASGVDEVDESLDRHRGNVREVTAWQTSARSPMHLLYAVFAAVACAYVAWRSRDRLLAWWRPRSGWLGLGVGLAMVLLGAGYSQALRWLGYVPPASPPSPSPATMSLVALIVPFAEEMFFRGRLWDVVEARSSAGFAALISGVFFTAAHPGWVVIPFIVVASILLGWLRHRSGGLFAPFLAHALNNFSNFYWNP